MKKTAKVKRPVENTPVAVKERPSCRLLELPLHLIGQAAATSAAINPSNRPRPGMGLRLGVKPSHLAMLVNVWWGAKGVDLAVKFVDENRPAVKKKVLDFANLWNQYGNIQFRESSTGQVRVALHQGGGYASYLGNDILQIPTNEPTMWLQDIDTQPDSEWMRVVPHEFGHTLGCPHEHERVEILNQLDVEKTVALFESLYGWDRQTTMEQVLSPINPNSIRASAPDTRSIMCYDFPGSITKTGQPIPGGDRIDLIDQQFIATQYPKPNAPPPPPPPPPPVSSDASLFCNLSLELIPNPNTLKPGDTFRVVASGRKTA